MGRVLTPEFHILHHREPREQISPVCKSRPCEFALPLQLFLHQLQIADTSLPPPHPTEMAKKSSRKTLKGLFSKSEASLDGAAERDAETEVEKKKFKLFRIKSKSKGGSGPEKAASEEQLARR